MPHFDERVIAIPSNLPKVSVIIPCRDVRPEWLLECLASLRSQSFRGFETIVVDDASKAPVREVFEKRRAMRGSPRLIRHDVNRGLGAARNTGVMASTGRYLLPLDADDALEPGFLEETVAVLDADPMADCVFTNLRFFGEAEGIQETEVRGPRDMILGQWIPGAGTLFRRQLWERVGGYSTDPVFRAGNEDWDFWLAACSLGLSARHTGDSCYCYRRTGSSMSNTMMKKEFSLTTEAMYRRHKDFIDRNGLGRRFRFEGYTRTLQGAGSIAAASRAALRGLLFVPDPLSAGRLAGRYLLTLSHLVRRGKRSV